MKSVLYDLRTMRVVLLLAVLVSKILKRTGAQRRFTKAGRYFQCYYCLYFLPLTES